MGGREDEKAENLLVFALVVIFWSFSSFLFFSLSVKLVICFNVTKILVTDN